MTIEGCQIYATHLAPHVRRMLVHKSLRGIAQEKLGDDEEAHFLLTVQCLLQNMAAVTVRSKINHAATSTLSSARRKTFVRNIRHTAYM